MMNLRRSMQRVLVPAVLALLCAAPAFAQMKTLRQSDDQFIAGLSEQGMSDLLEHFVETDPPQDPIAQLALEVALKKFIADDRLARANQANQLAGEAAAVQQNDQAAEYYAQAIRLFDESRQAYEDVIAAQKKLIADNPDDERVPLWQTDYASMLLDYYLVRYFSNVNWVYEFGLPTDEQRAAYESSMVEAFKAMVDAATRFDDLPIRLGQNPDLKSQLESMGIFFKIEDYRAINTPYWLAQAAHGVSLLPAEHPYYQAKNVRNQKLDPEAEKNRLRGMVVDALANRLMRDEGTKQNAKLFSGRTLVWSDKIDDIDDGVDVYLEEVITDAADQWQGFLATLSKAVGRWKGGELDTAMQILSGMDRHPYVRADRTITSRLLAADLMFRILRDEAMKLPEARRPEKIAEAYEKAYVALIDGNADQRYRNTLFERWANDAGDVDPNELAALPAAVRMGIGEQLTNQGGAIALQIQFALGNPPPAIPDEARQWREQLEAMREEADALNKRAALFNQTLIGDDMEGPILARGLYNLAFNQYWLAQLSKLMDEGKANEWVPLFEAAKLWLAVLQRVPDAAQAQQSAEFVLNVVTGMEVHFNSSIVKEKGIREVYQGAFEYINERTPQLEAAHNNRVYAGFHLYEKIGDFDQAVAVYRALPSTHKDYFQARRQMLYVLQRQFLKMADSRRLMEATRPADDAPQQVLNAWEAEHAQLLEDIERLRGDAVEEADLVILDAEDVVENEDDANQRFTAATAMGAAKVVLASIKADAGETAEALQMLEGFEKEFAVDGPYGQLAAMQQKPDAAKANLRGLVQSAQEQRIIALIDAGQVEPMAEQAKAMMDASPNVAANVVYGVLDRIETTIERERRAEENAAFARQAERARENIKTQAQFAVKLGELLVQWARAQGFNPSKMATYEMALAESLVLAGRTKEAIAIMDPIAKAFPTNFTIRMKTGKAYVEVYRALTNRTNDAGIKTFNKAHEQFAEIIKYYNARPNDKPAMYWDAWLRVITLKDLHGGDLAAKDIPKHARMLRRVDENFGGPEFKDEFLELFDRNGGIERLQPK